MYRLLGFGGVGCLVGRKIVHLRSHVYDRLAALRKFGVLHCESLSAQLNNVPDLELYRQNIHRRGQQRSVWFTYA